MNISSIIIYVLADEFMDDIKNKLEKIKELEIVTAQDCKIVAVVEAEFNDEIAIFREIERMNGVKNVAVAYSYQNLEKEIEIASTNDIESIMRKTDKQDIKDIVYHGDIKLK